MLDTDTASDIMKGVNANLLARLAQTSPADICVSVVSSAELHYGIAVSPKPLRDRKALVTLLKYVAVLDFPKEAAPHYAEIRATLKVRGEPIGVNDLWIAAHARFQGLTLITNNTREFSRVPGLQIENWV